MLHALLMQPADVMTHATPCPAKPCTVIDTLATDQRWVITLR